MHLTMHPPAHPHGRFTTRFDATWLTTKQCWKLRQPLVYEDPSGHEHIVPAGFETDGASVPWFLRSFTYSRERLLPVAALHDWHYRVIRVNRLWADDLMFHGSRALDVNKLSARFYWRVLRATGWWAWWRNGRRTT